MSVAVSMPSTLAVYSRRSLSLTVTSFASRTTCALVRIRPSELMMKPEPMPLNGVDGFWRPRCPPLAGDAAEELEERIVLHAGRQALVLERRLVHAFDGDADDGRRRLLDDGAVVRHLAGGVLSGAAGTTRSPCLRRGLGDHDRAVLALEPVRRQVERTGGADHGDAGAEERCAQGIQLHGRSPAIRRSRNIPRVEAKIGTSRLASMRERLSED